jgi:hypothetical protein
MAEQIKISIKLKAKPPTASAQPIVSAPKPPFDRRKISGAILLCLSLLVAIIYFVQPLTAQSIEQNDGMPEPSENAAAQMSNDAADLISSTSGPQNNQHKVPPSASPNTNNAAQPINSETRADTLPPVKSSPLSSMSLREENNKEETPAAPKPTEPASTASNKQTTHDQPAASLSKPAESAPATSDLASITEEPSQHSWFNQQLVRAQLTSNIKQREPQDELEGLDLSQLNKLYLFIELRQMQRQTVEVRWYKQQQLQASVELAIGGPRWRTYASKQFDKRSRGQWRVAIFHQQQLIFEQYFKVQ